MKQDNYEQIYKFIAIQLMQKNITQQSVLSKSSAFVTPTEEVTIQDLYKQIHKTIDDLDDKIEDVIKKNQAEFLFAYRNHLKKIKKQLAQIKDKSQQQQQMFSSNDRIQFLEKQISIFREQALKLYDKLQEKTQQVQIYKVKLGQIDKQFAIKEREMKQLTKNTKLSEAARNMLEMKLIQLQEQLKKKDQQIYKLNFEISSMKNQTAEKISMNTSVLPNQRRLSVNATQHNLKLRTASLFRHSNLNNNNFDYQLKNWFLSCIKTVKRQISQRKTYVQNSSFDLTSIKSIEEFKMVDKLRLLQLFLENQKLLTWIYERMFPDRLAEVRQYLQVKQSPLKRQQNSAFSNKIQYYDEEVMQNRLIDEAYLPKLRNADPKTKKSEIRNKVSIKNGKLNLSVF